MFPPVNPKINFPELEKEILAFWKKERISQRSIEERGGTPSVSSPRNPFRQEYLTPSPRKDNTRGKEFAFYDGPPFATGLPHYGHILAGIIKDVVPRYQTMKGYRVERRFGWDCHGLPIENIKEKELGISGKEQIEEYGIAKFNEECRSIVQRYVHDWRALVERTGRWVDMDDDYRTMDADYMESVWWVFKQLWEKKYVYEDFKAMQICPRCTTPLSNFEVSQGYKEITDWSVIAKFPVTDEGFLATYADGKRTSLLAWTTTPWSIPTTMGLAVGKDFDYVIVESQGERFIFAQSRLDYLTKGLEEGSWKMIFRLKGSEIEGLPYEHPFTGVYAEHPLVRDNANAHRTYATDYVSTEEGTGIVTINGAYGEIDMESARKFNLPIVINVHMDGTYDETMNPVGLAGAPVKPADDPTKTDQKIAAHLEKTGFLFRKEAYRHSYPHCWRCDHPLLNYATKSWFISVTKLKDKLLKNNSKTSWVPASMKDGRFGKWLENARDWAVSRNRYWGAPLPVWRCDACGETKAIGSLDELFENVPQRMVKIILVRHGESEKQILKINAASDAETLPLTEKGLQQAKEMVKNLQGEKIAAVYSSPMLRTRQTAEFFLPSGKSLSPRRRGMDPTLSEAKGMRRKGLSDGITDDRIREVSKGKFEGVPKADPAYVAACEEFNTLSPEGKWTYRWGDTGQTDAELESRVQSFLDEVLAKHAGQTIVVSSHSAVLRFFVKLLRGMSPPDFYHKRDTLTMKPGSSKTLYVDATTNREFDLHKHVVDDIIWRCECKTPSPLRGASRGKHVIASETHEDSNVNGERITSFLGEGGSPKLERSEGVGETEGVLRRVPEVLDCWFESGSMPYAQLHYPFENKEKFEKNFPANFIAEGQDQTRGWFYTLMVLSTALFNKPAFQNVIVNGIVLAEDGRKMSKKLKNYPDPSVVMEQYGADAMRWYLMASPAVSANDLRFSEKGVDEVVKSVLLPLWNAYSFFVTYANIDGWRPDDSPEFKINNLKLKIPSNPLDRWILSELQTTISSMTEALDGYDLARATKPILDFLDALTNWYIRRSRRRFWRPARRSLGVGGKSENDTDKNEAYTTLYHVLIETTKLTAPFIPFISEEMYRGLNAPFEKGGQGDLPTANSVHLASWPEADSKLVNEKLNTEISLVRMVVSLGLRLRGLKKVKVRQPLLRAQIVVNDAQRKVIETYAEIITEELNVKEIEFVQNVESVAKLIARPNGKLIGPKFGSDVQEIITNAKAGNFREEHGKIVVFAPLSPVDYPGRNAESGNKKTNKKDENAPFEKGGQGDFLVASSREWMLSPDEVEIAYEGKEGREVAADAGVVVSLDFTITPQLQREGMAREIVRTIQDLRKEAGYNVSDRILIGMTGVSDLVEAEWGDYIQRETLGTFTTEMLEWDVTSALPDEGEVGVKKNEYRNTNHDG